MTGKTQDQSLRGVFLFALRDLYYAENAILKALPKMMANAKDADLKAMLHAHSHETQGHVQRLEKVFKELDQKPVPMRRQAIEAMLSEADEMMEEFGSGPAGDAAIVFACQAVEHYEINRYGTLRAWANQLKLGAVADLLKQTLEEEHRADQKLTNLARSYQRKEGLIEIAAKAACMGVVDASRMPLPASMADRPAITPALFAGQLAKATPREAVWSSAVSSRRQSA